MLNLTHSKFSPYINGSHLMETPNFEAVEKKSNLVKAEAYQARSDLEEMIATIDAISATVFLGDRQLANQITGLLTQQIYLAVKDITT